ncbi:MAG TPA: helix-turn-helix transcriptional regulator [Ktedonosporobacter sp.]|jgi:transcriptional regulator with XRE-family HTH domain|nr:helix-turn-helix transcriptional regulator [Ktedonosporobacter sp.]
MERARLSQARHKKFWTLEEAAERIGVDPASLSRWEKGKSFPQPINIQRLCNAYGMTVQQLGLEDDPVSGYEHDAPPVVDALTQFQQQDLTLRLMRIVWQWSHQNARYSVLQTLITQELEQSMNEDVMSRRDALRRLALLPVEMLGLSAAGAVLKYPIEDILSQCAAGMTACQHLLRGKELVFASDVVSRYIPTLKAIVHTSSTTQRKAAADLLAQGYRLKSILARHVKANTDSIACAQQAAMYADEAQNPLLQAVALRAQAAAYYYANCWAQASQAAEQARAVLETSRGAPIPPLVRSHIYVGLATYQARNGQKQEALRSLGQAHAAFFAQPPDEPAPIWINHDKANLILYDGITHLHLGMQKEALDSFAQIQLTASNHEINRVEALLNQVVAEVSRVDSRDMEYCIDHWIQGIEGAKALRSEQRFTEAIQAYTALCAVWPSEPRIKELRAYITHW